jgi:hypothetical protein
VHRVEPAPLPLWPLPLVAGALPCAAVLIAWAVSARLGLVPDCNPFVEGCFSLSRAARHDLANHLFKAIVLPAAALQALSWGLAARWLAGARSARALPALGVIAGAALALYGAFLGTEGPAYRALRQWGTVAYFGFTCVAMLIVGNVVVRHRRQPPWLRHALQLLLVALVLLGLSNVFLGELFGEPSRERIQNVTEWWGSVLMTLLWFALALIWRRERVGLAVSSGG